jgi:hypothetical protein
MVLRRLSSSQPACPEQATFVDADEPSVDAEIRRAADEGRAIVLVAADGSTRTLFPQLAPQ